MSIRASVVVTAPQLRLDGMDLDDGRRPPGISRKRAGTNLVGMAGVAERKDCQGLGLGPSSVVCGFHDPRAFELRYG